MPESKRALRSEGKWNVPLLSRSLTTLLFILTWILRASAGVLPPDAVVAGKTLGEWNAEWYKWTFSCPTNLNPLRDTNGVNALNCQPDGPVLFLAGVQFGDLRTATRTFSIPEGKYLCFPVLNVYAGDPADPKAIEDRRDAAAAFITNFSEMHASIDGVGVPNLPDHRAISPVFSFEFPSCDNMMTVNNGFCISGLVDDLVADGYYLMLEPLPVGEHVINFGGSFHPPFNFSIDITSTITVVPVPLSDRVANLLSELAASGLPAKRQRALAVSLKAARASFEAGRVQAGIRQLIAFQHKVRAQIAPLDTALAAELIQSAQDIVERAEGELK